MKRPRRVLIVAAMESAISVSGLRKSFGAIAAVRGIDLEVPHGEIFAFLGPNGAGKTTTVEILEGFQEADAGEVSVLGADSARAPRSWRERVGIVLQESPGEIELTVRECLEFYAGLYAAPRGVEETLSQVGLGEAGEQKATELSGGQRRRLDVALALVGDPELLFLDEPTTGFDPSARRSAWELVRSLRALGKTILLTTHYLDEAQQLADRVAVIRDGRIVRQGAPSDLIGATPQVEIVYREDGREVVIETKEPTRVLADLTGTAVAEGRELDGLEVRRPSLEDVYLDLVDGDGDLPENA